MSEFHTLKDRQIQTRYTKRYLIHQELVFGQKQTCFKFITVSEENDKAAVTLKCNPDPDTIDRHRFSYKKTRSASACTSRSLSLKGKGVRCGSCWTLAALPAHYIFFFSTVYASHMARLHFRPPDSAPRKDLLRPKIYLLVSMYLLPWPSVASLSSD